jgi:hypothetical protein
MNLDKYMEAEQILPPGVVSVLVPFFTKSFLGKDWNGQIWNPAMAPVRVVGSFSKLAALGRGSGTPLWVNRDSIRIAKGYLNRPGPLHEFATTLDLTTAGGMAKVAHEVFHCYEWQTRGWRYRWNCVMNTLFGWIGQRFHVFSAEQRALAFEKRVHRRIAESMDQLVQFYQCRPAGFEA